jgi:hypothetical protein
MRWSGAFPRQEQLSTWSAASPAVGRKMDAPSLMPDISAPLTLGDLMAGRDPALSAVIEAR